MGMGVRTAMPTETDLLTLAQWFSPSFPVGAFAYSHGLEWAIESGQVTDANTAQGWIADVLEFGSGHNDSLFLAAAYAAQDPGELDHLDARCRAFAAARERVMETDLQGVAFCRTVAAVWGHELADYCYPVAIGRAARLQGLPLLATTQVYLHSVLANLAAVAMRLVPLGQTDGQIIIHTLSPLLADIAANAVPGGLDDLGTTSFLADIAAMKHETQYSRIFRT